MREASEPALQLIAHDAFEHGDGGIGIIEAGNDRELLAASFLESLPEADGHLFQRFHAIGCKTRAHHDQFLDTLGGKLLHRLLGIGLQPFRLGPLRCVNG